MLGIGYWHMYQSHWDPFRTALGKVQGRASMARPGQCTPSEDGALVWVEATQLKDMIIQWLNIKILQLRQIEHRIQYHKTFTKLISPPSHQLSH